MMQVTMDSIGRIIVPQEEVREEGVRLKRCPCCGGRAVIKKQLPYYCYVVCERCELHTSAKLSLYCDEKGAVAAWNQRVFLPEEVTV